MNYRGYGAGAQTEQFSATANCFRTFFNDSTYLNSKAAQMNCDGIPNLDGSGRPNGGNGGMGPGMGGGNGGMGPGMGGGPQDGSGPNGGTDLCPWTSDAVQNVIVATGMNAEVHYKAFGCFERNEQGEYGIDPGQNFDTSKYYLWKQSLMQKDGLNVSMEELVNCFRTANLDPLTHYATIGQTEGIRASAVQNDAINGMTEWNEAAYTTANPDVAGAIAVGLIGCGFEHYLFYGQFEGRALA